MSEDAGDRVGERFVVDARITPGATMDVAVSRVPCMLAILLER